MMKKVVVKLDIHDEKDKKEAMAAISSLNGVNSVEFDVIDGKMTVVGEVDPVVVVRKLMKRWNAEILSVGPSEDPKKDGDKKDGDKKDGDKKDGDKKYGEDQTPKLEPYYDYYLPLRNQRQKCDSRDIEILLPAAIPFINEILKRKKSQKLQRDREDSEWRDKREREWLDEMKEKRMRRDEKQQDKKEQKERERKAERERDEPEQWRKILRALSIGSVWERMEQRVEENKEREEEARQEQEEEARQEQEWEAQVLLEEIERKKQVQEENKRHGAMELEYLKMVLELSIKLFLYMLQGNRIVFQKKGYPNSDELLSYLDLPDDANKHIFYMFHVSVASLLDESLQFPIEFSDDLLDDLFDDLLKSVMTMMNIDNLSAINAAESAVDLNQLYGGALRRFKIKYSSK